MPAPVETRTMPRSQKLYERLLALYPKAHRDEYGPPMAQLFRDQSRDAWREARSWGVVALWLRVLPDLVKTSFLEHLAALKGKKSMTDKISEVTGPGSAPLRTLLRVAVPVFLLVFGLTVVVTFILPESFASTARIKVDAPVSGSTGQNGSPAGYNGQYDPYFIQTEFEVIQSEVVLGQVIKSLDLNMDWGRKYGGGNKLKTSETLRVLKSRIDLRPVRNTRLIEVHVFSESPAEAAKIANAVAEAYRTHRQEQRWELTMSGVKALRNQFDEQDAKVRDAQAQVDKLRKELNLSATDTAGNSATPTMEAEVVRRVQGELISFETMLMKDEAVLRELEKLSPDQRRDALQTVLGPDETLNRLLAEMNSAELTLLGLQKEFGSDHPKCVTAKAVADGALKRVNERVAGVMIGLANRIDGLKATTENLQKRLDQARAVDIDKAERSRPYYEAKVRLEELGRFRSILGAKLASERVDAELPKSTLVEIIDRAVPGLRPVRPNKPLNLACGAFGGMLLALLVGGGAALIVSLFRKRAPRQTATP